MLKTVLQKLKSKSTLIKQMNLGINLNKSRLIYNSSKLLCKDKDDSDEFKEKYIKYKNWQVNEVQEILKDSGLGEFNAGINNSEFITDVIFDTNEEQLLEEEGILIKPSFTSYSLPVFKRGKTGVFDIEQIIEIAKSEKAIDIAVLKIPEDRKYCDYLVILCPKSVRHALAMTENINKIYKKTKHVSDPFLGINKNDSDWIAIDMVNIVIHIMANRLREDFDLESLWTLGELYDPQIRKTIKEEQMYLVQDIPLKIMENE